MSANLGKRWGQLTAMAFIGSDGEWLIFGTGRGLLYHEIFAVLGASASTILLLVFYNTMQKLAMTSHFVVKSELIALNYKISRLPSVRMVTEQRRDYSPLIGAC
ncbi:uncharacterized protein EV420DRAFT_1487598 [Desarmillaria tabescens]|uniref:Uncharacterized protein n=1 Tax=Armillaria tabescens TaxID=1929756 RepID=A0AA39J8S2_ARMTA|nr:uncharacterized protein EV420DRAFT_1487598 [Desarmillaria tabescens]KAK0436318.1 hypothetical protein EV420DRAFT_1487598 [Desarmillaria tabescens]